MPYDWKSEQAKDTELNQVMKAVNDKYCRCNTGSVAVIGGYHGFGTTTDYMYEKQRAKYVYTWEVFGDLKVRNPTRTNISGASDPTLIGGRFGARRTMTTAYGCLTR